jgi:hypothetical protein
MGLLALSTEKGKARGLLKLSYTYGAVMYRSKLSLTATNKLRSHVWTLDSLPPQVYPRRIMGKVQTGLWKLFPNEHESDTG